MHLGIFYRQHMHDMTSGKFRPAEPPGTFPTAVTRSPVCHPVFREIQGMRRNPGQYIPRVADGPEIIVRPVAGICLRGEKTRSGEEQLTCGGKSGQLPADNQQDWTFNPDQGPDQEPPVP